MKKDIARQLKDKAEYMAELYSSPERAKNRNSETFEVEEIIPISEFTAAVVYKKNTEKRAVFFYYYIKGQEKWEYFVPLDSHILGMKRFEVIKEKVEQGNYRFNFDMPITEAIADELDLPPLLREDIDKGI